MTKSRRRYKTYGRKKSSQSYGRNCYIWQNGKTVKRTYKLKAHDEENKCEIGDKVKVMETRPLSKDKRWRVVEILEKGGK